MIGKSLRAIFDSILKRNVIDEELVDEIVRELQRHLIANDVDIEIVLEISENIKKRAKEEFKKLKKNVEKREFIISILYDELKKIIAEGKKVDFYKNKKIMLVGLFGSGKTTTAAKLAYLIKKKNLKPLLVCADTQRKAAFEQLKQLADLAKVDFFGLQNEKDPINIVKSIDYDSYSNIILDTAGRDSLNEEMLDEIKKIQQAFLPDITFYVISADIGKAAKNQIKQLTKIINIDGIIVTKADSSAKAGNAIIACKEANAPIVFLGTGEKIQDIKPFNRGEFLNSLLGFPNIKEILENVKDAFSNEDKEALEKGEFNFEIMLKQIQQMENMGPFSKILEMFGFSNYIDESMAVISQDKMKKFKSIIQSMTKQERKNPEIIDYSRMRRIAKGSGRTVKDVQELLSYYKKMKKIMKKTKQLYKEGSEINMQELFKLFRKGKKLRL